MEFVHRRRRGAELFLLVLALAVGIGAYAAVGLGVEGEVPADIVGVRRLAGRPDRRRPHHGPHRRAVRRPGAAARRGRPQRPRPRGHPPPRPGLRAAGRPAHLRPPAADLDDARRRSCSSSRWSCCATTGCSSASPTPAGCAAIVLLLLPMVPGHRQDRSTAPGSGSTSAGFSFQPGEVAKVLLVIAFAGYLVLHRDALALAGRRVALRRPAARSRPRPDPGDVGCQPGHPGLPARPRLQPAVLRPLPGRCSTSPPSGPAGWSSAASCSSPARCAAYTFFGHVQNRFNFWLHPMDYYDDAARQLPARRGAVRHGLGRPDRPRLRQRLARRIPFAESDFISRRIGEELGLTASWR